MSTLAERVTELISDLGMSKTEFAKRINVSQGFISQVCSGASNLSPRTEAAIAHEFNVNIDWLRTGDGDKQMQLTRDEEIEKFVGEALADESDDFKKRFLFALSRLHDEEWAVIAKMAESLAEK